MTLSPAAREVRSEREIPSTPMIPRMSPVLNRKDAPNQLFNIPELDFSDDLFTERLSGPWFRLAAWTVTLRRDERQVEDVVSRQTLLLTPSDFVRIFENLESVGNVIGHLGKPTGYVVREGERERYGYAPFHRFEFSFLSVSAEPLVFVHHSTSGAHLFVNPDLWLFFELEERCAKLWALVGSAAWS
jgi:hypothetical protein